MKQEKSTENQEDWRMAKTFQCYKCGVEVMGFTAGWLHMKVNTLHFIRTH